VRHVLPILVLACLPQAAAAADRKAVDQAVKRGADYLADEYKNLKKPDGGEGIGPAALAGLALLETGRTLDDPAVKAIAAAVRDASYTETRTYQLALCLLFLDRLGRKTDEPLIQLCAVRLLMGQNANGGWTYDCIQPVSEAEERRLRTRLDENQLVAEGKGANPPKKDDAKENPAKPLVGGKLHADVERHRQGLLANARNRITLPDDNSNTQFGILAVWVARKHGVNTEAALEALEKRFIHSQLPGGGWPYSGLLGDGSPSMTCAGLIGLATAVGRREERRMQAAVPKRPDVKSEPKVDEDPFFIPEPKPEPKKPDLKKFPGDARDKAVAKGLEALGDVLKNGRRQGRNADRSYYFLWSLERVGVVFGLQKIGGVDWYEWGSDILVDAQKRDGSWHDGGYAADIETSFALLFLARSNLVRDLSAKVQRGSENELRSGGTIVEPMEPAPMAEPRGPTAKVDPAPSIAPMPVPVKPATLPAGDEAAKLAEALLKVPAAGWAKALEQLRDGKGSDFTTALVLVIGQTDGDRRKAARDALSERLTRMSAATLRTLLSEKDIELRRAAALACAMKDDKAHIPDLIDRIEKDEEFVVKAARAGLKSLSGGKDYGPEPGFTKLDRAVAVEEWTAWWQRNKK
jgi:hypothetical protein